MNLIKDHPFHITDQVCALVQHGAKDLGGHDEAGSLGPDLNVSRQQPNLSD